MTGTFKSLLHRALNALGIEVRLLGNLRAQQMRDRDERWRQHFRPIHGYGIHTILDIGANEGQFAAMMRTEFPEARVYSFEPLPEVFAKLKAKFANDERVVPVNLALGETAGAAVMQQSAFSPSSSLLPMAELHKQEWPQSISHAPVNVRVQTLDGWALETGLQPGPGLLVKMDVQGFELAVINGGERTLRGAAVLIVEVSFRELYIGQPLFAQIHDRLASLGFRYSGNIEQSLSKDGGQILFADAIFENVNHGNTYG